ncbi:glycosyltransferase family 2 protein [Niveispirillum sp. BGYR6]|uniref:glycosyltransferase family 2 protein n=1 Tax=Niveispirillum sp. BGYR6 TaxID=2971249 RepID=UPI0022B9B087|nr:glycosyltransferase family 2 protein [Niveispirillum sp. BGYR6]MDG5496498.1 glycosyltransferase family 2 protein [Niveispirillum sp. BGYR6]
MARTDILLATYNGETYLPALIASIEAQRDRDYRVLVRDDGSRDGTLTLIDAWRRRDSERVLVLEADQPAGGAAANFARLMAVAEAPYVLFADQDDVWHPDKVGTTVAALMRAEAELGRETPVLAFCDLAVVDADGAVINPSFRHFQGMDAVAGAAFNRLLTENVVTGCAMGINRSACRIGCNVPAESLMHDWWLALVCAGLGKIITMPECLIDYRQHGNNAVGAKAWSAADAIRDKIRSGRFRANQQRFLAWMDRLYAQAAALERLHGAQLPPAQARTLAAFRSLPQQSFLVRRMRMIRHGFRLSGVIRTIGFYLRA